MLSGQYLFRMNDKTTHKHTDNNRTRKPDFSPLLTQDVECTLRRRLGALFRGVPGAGARQEEVPREVRMSQQPRVRKRKNAAARHQQLQGRGQRGEEDAGSEEEEENHDPRSSPPHKRHEADRTREQYQGKQLPDANRRWVVLPSWSKDALEEGNRDVLAANERAQAMAEAAMEARARDHRGGVCMAGTSEQQRQHHPCLAPHQHRHHHHDHQQQQQQQDYQQTRMPQVLAQSWPGPTGLAVSQPQPQPPGGGEHTGDPPRFQRITFMPGLPPNHPSRQQTAPAPPAAL